MNSLIAIGAGIAALTGIEQVLVSDLQPQKQRTQSQDSRKQTEKSQKHYYLDVHWPKVLQFSVW